MIVRITIFAMYLPSDYTPLLLEISDLTSIKLLALLPSEPFPTEFLSFKLFFSPSSFSKSKAILSIRVNLRSERPLNEPKYLNYFLDSSNLLKVYNHLGDSGMTRTK